MQLLELVEQEQSLRFTFGRFNPPHIGHKKLLDAVGDGFVFYYFFFFAFFALFFAMIADVIDDAAM